MWHTKNAFFHEMQFWSHCYTVVSYQALFRLSVYKIPAVYLSGAKNVCFCTIGDLGSPTIYNIISPDVYVANHFERIYILTSESLTVGTIYMTATFPSIKMYGKNVFYIS